MGIHQALKSESPRCELNPITRIGVPGEYMRLLWALLEQRGTAGCAATPPKKKRSFTRLPLRWGFRMELFERIDTHAVPGKGGFQLAVIQLYGVVKAVVFSRLEHGIQPLVD